MNTPLTYVTYRVFIASLTLLLILSIGLGLAGFGPAHGLHQFTDDAINWLQLKLNVRLR